MQVGGPAQRLVRRSDAFGCSFQYDEEQRPCMVFVRLSLARVPNPPVVCIHLDELWKWQDDAFFWQATKEMTETLSAGHYSSFEHRNLSRFVNDCMADLFSQKPFPEALVETARIDVEQRGRHIDLILH